MTFSQREILEAGRALEFPSLGRMNGSEKNFSPLHSLVKFHSGLTKRNPENHHFPGDVSRSCEQQSLRTWAQPSPSCSSSCAGLWGWLCWGSTQRGHRAGREGSGNATLVWVPGLSLLFGEQGVQCGLCCLGCVLSADLEQSSGGELGSSPSPPVLLRAGSAPPKLSRAASVSVLCWT